MLPSNDAWNRVKPFRNVEAARIRYLTEGECKRLINAADPDFRRLVRAALYTGCRYGELIRLVTRDFDRSAGTVTIGQSKSGKTRHVYLTDEARRFFDDNTVGRKANDLIFVRDDNEPWGTQHQQRRMQAACETAKIDPPISFHVLRHSYGSLLARKGVPLQVIAHALGHADTRMTERHYAHLQPDYVAVTIRANLPNFGLEKSNVQRI